MTSALAIRPAVAADLPALGLLGAALSQQHLTYDVRRFSRFAAVADPQGQFVREQQQFLATQLGRPGTVLLVAELEGVAAGYSFGLMQPANFALGLDETGWVYDLYLGPLARGAGHGPALLAATVAALYALGAPAVLLHVAEQNTAGQRLFQRAGFRFTMREMRLDLPTPAKLPCP